VISNGFSQCLPLVAGAAYAASALWSKRATMEGGGLWRMTFLTNWGQALLFLPFLFAGEGSLEWADGWKITVTSLVYFVGQVVVFAGLRFGDVSVVTPVMGIKVLVVAALAVVFNHEQLPVRWWFAAAVAALAAALLGGGAVGDRRRVFAGVAGGLVASVAFAGVDILFQRWGGGLGVWRFTSLVMCAMGVWSFLLLPWMEGPWWHLPGEARRAFFPSLLFAGVQSSLMAYCVVVLEGAAWANLLYSSRGLWSVLLVWFLGPFFGNQERENGSKVMWQRLLGSGLLLAAIALVLR
jgi:drug/metabolite transporter (DMT)-like permease